jgi:lipoprotein-anchoring transpeptidase ErfK/SrfK
MHGAVYCLGVAMKASTGIHVFFPIQRQFGAIALALLISLWSIPGLYPIPVMAQVAQQKGETRTAIATAIQELKQSEHHWIEIDLSSQRLTAWEGGQPVYAVIVSTGKAESPTLTRIFAIQTRYRYARMQGEDYDTPDVPYTMYYSGNYDIHGTYWHNRFGTPVSHGCVNVAVDHAR